jgi:hypothetical protein
VDKETMMLSKIIGEGLGFLPNETLNVVFQTIHQGL